LCDPLRVAVAALGIVFFFVTAAHAQRVVLVGPPEADAVLTEAFNRLRGELAMHGFEVDIQTADGAVSPENLAQRAESSQAVASVTFVRNEAFATADIKISDRVTGKTSIRTIATPAGTDGASLLALRAVELLRASLREFGPTTETPKDIIGAIPERASPAITEWVEGKRVALASPEEPPVLTHITTPVLIPYHVTLRADALAALHVSDHSSSYGFGGALGVSKGSHFEARLVFAAPWFGAKYSTPRANSAFHLMTSFAEVTYALVINPQVQIEPLLGIGVARATTYTQTIYPVVLHPPAPWAWFLLTSAGFGVKLSLSEHVFWITSARVAVLSPRPVLSVDGEHHKLGVPMLMMASGVGVKF